MEADYPDRQSGDGYGRRRRHICDLSHRMLELGLGHGSGVYGQPRVG
jgi:hypothetical protein